ncbi:MAG: hypothetical protein LC663_03565 [Actinobacteria bacterium]|nr:hypothetical protein [Actinomycetota bacterium]
MPEALVGKAGTIRVLVHIDSVTFKGAGTGVRAASIALTIAGHTWTLAQTQCAATCTHRALAIGDQTLETAVSSLPATLRATISTTASLRNARGSVGAELRGSLRSVGVTPA